MVGVLGAVQRLVQELTVVLSSLDQGNATQLPQQVSMQQPCKKLFESVAMYLATISEVIPHSVFRVLSDV